MHSYKCHGALRLQMSAANDSVSRGRLQYNRRGEPVVMCLLWLPYVMGGHYIFAL